MAISYYTKFIETAPTSTMSLPIADAKEKIKQLSDKVN